MSWGMEVVKRPDWMPKEAGASVYKVWITVENPDIKTLVEYWPMSVSQDEMIRRRDAFNARADAVDQAYRKG